MLVSVLFWKCYFQNLLTLTFSSLGTVFDFYSDRQQLVQQMQLIGSGAHGVQAAATIRHVAAQNGVWSLGNFGGVPPKSAMTFYQPNASEETRSSSTASVDQNDTASALGALKIDAPDYRFVFNSCGFAMVR